MMSLASRKSNRFRLHSIGVELQGHGAERLLSDFDFFTDRPRDDKTGPERFCVKLEILPRATRQGDLPTRAADQIFPDCVLFREGESLFYEYDGAVLAVHRGKNSSHGQLICKDETLAHELGYLYLQSEIGRFLDDQGLHRVHALGLALPDGRAALVLLPSGGGKSTLAAEILQNGGCQLLSDDSPLVDRFGNVHPYPLRLSFRPGAELPEKWKEQATVFQRRKYGEKLLVPTGALPGYSLPRPEEKFRPGFLVIARRHGHRTEPGWERLPRWKGATPIIRDLVVGLGIPKVAELVLTNGARSLPGLLPMAASRTAAASAFLMRSTPFRLDLARDQKSNARFLLKQLMQGTT